MTHAAPHPFVEGEDPFQPARSALQSLERPYVLKSSP